MSVAVPLPNPRLRGIFAMIGAMGALSALDAVAKWLTAGYPVTEVVFFRSVFTMLPVGVMLAREGGFGSLRTQRLGAHLLRAAIGVATASCFFMAVWLMPLADATAIVFTGTLFVTALSVPLLGERVGPRRWAAVLVGFLGAMVIVRPGMGVFGTGAWFALGAAFCYALVAISTRWLGRTENSTTMAFYYAAFGGLISLAGLPFGWVMPTWEDLGLFVLLGLFGGVGSLLLGEAFRHAPVALVAPFEYTALVWATILGFVFWHELPDAFTWAGAAILVASGLYVMHREHKMKGED
ncbi:MAG: DMT family transporter [Alphaproteobacteria bacterium]